MINGYDFNLSNLHTSENLSQILRKIIDVNYHNIIITGKTGVGKTSLALTLLRTLHLENQDKLKVSINDKHDNITASQVLSPSNLVELNAIDSNIEVDKLIKFASILEPYYIYLPEVNDDNSQAVLNAINDGNKLITTMHSFNPQEINGKLLNMIERSGGHFVKPTRTIEIFIDEITFQDKPLRYISEVIEYTDDEKILVFKHTPNDHLTEGHLKFIPEEGELSLDFINALVEYSKYK